MSDETRVIMATILIIAWCALPVVFRLINKGREDEKEVGKPYKWRKEVNAFSMEDKEIK